MSGQSIVDRLNAAKHTVAGSALGRAVVKATTEEIMAPKRKHLEYLLACTSEINVSIPQMADLLIERTQNSSWVVTFKALVTIHHLMCYGNERFSQYMASHSSKFLLSNFFDKSGVQGADMSTYIRKYANYLNEKRETYKLMGFDFCKVKRGKDDGMLRTMVTDKLLKTLPIIHQQLEALLEFDVQPSELTNGVINASFILLSKDLIRLYACYNDGIINLLEKFFDMNKKNCKEALDIYKKFLERTDQVSAFLKVAESAGMEKGDIPDLAKAPGSLLEALESHLATLENKKTVGGAANQPQTGTKVPSSVTSAINSLSSNTSLSQEERRKVIEEEAKTLESFRLDSSKAPVTNTKPADESNLMKKQTSGSNVSAPAPQAAAVKSNADDLFSVDFKSSSNNGMATRPSDDLLMLATESSVPNPFMSLNSPPQNTAPAGNLFQNNNLFGAMTQPVVPPVANNMEFDAFASSNVLQPVSANGSLMKPTNSTNNLSNSNLTTNGTNENKQLNDAQKLFSTDLDSSLASLADNLDIKNKNNIFQKNHQWTAPQPQSQLKTGGDNWKPINANNPMAPATTAAPMWGGASGAYQPAMAPPMSSMPMNGWGGAPAMNNPFATAPMSQQPMMSQPGLNMGLPMNRLPMQNQMKPPTTVASNSSNPFSF